jgi:integrase
MVIFAAATGRRPSELFGLEWRDVDRDAGVVYVRRAFANGRLKQAKTRLSNRAVPLQAKALEAIDQLQPAENPILFANARGSRIDFRGFGRRHWKPANGDRASIRSAACTTSATLTRPSPFAPESRSSPSPSSWARASR